MSAHNTHIHDKIRKFSLNIPKYIFLVLSEEFPRDSVSRGKRASEYFE